MRKKILVTGCTALMLTACGGDHRDAQQVRNCPDWSSNPVSNYSNEDFSNAGCATTNNNYVQLQNKSDYYYGAGKPGITAARDSAILQNYYNGISASAAGSAPSSVSSGSR